MFSINTWMTSQTNHQINESGKMCRQRETLGHPGPGTGHKGRKRNDADRHYIRHFSYFVTYHFLNTSQGTLSQAFLGHKRHLSSLRATLWKQQGARWWAALHRGPCKTDVSSRQLVKMWTPAYVSKFGNRPSPCRVMRWLLPTLTEALRETFPQRQPAESNLFLPHRQWSKCCFKPHLSFVVTCYPTVLFNNNTESLKKTEITSKC